MTRLERRTKVFVTNLLLDNEIQIEGRNGFGEPIVMHPRREMAITMGEKEMEELVLELAHFQLTEESEEMIFQNRHVIEGIFEEYVAFKLN